jgi:hypothetical protein
VSSFIDQIILNRLCRECKGGIALIPKTWFFISVFHPDIEILLAYARDFEFEHQLVFVLVDVDRGREAASGYELVLPLWEKC